MKAMKVIRDNVRDVPFLLLGVVFSALASVWIFKTFCVGKESVVSNENNVLNELLPLQASSLVGYWSIALMCLGLDMMLPEEMIKMLKVQGQKNLFTTKEWFEAAGLSMLNLFVFAPMFVVPLWQYGWKDRYFEKWGNTTTISDFDLKTELFNMAIHAVVVDTVFYFTHRLIHYPYLYKRIHKIHHRFKAPVSVASMYAHPIEFVFGNLAGVILGPAITNCHPMTTAFWICLALFTTGGSHSGYKFLGAKSHDHHHQYFDCNFGVGGVWDSVFSTDYESWKIAREKRRLMKQKKKKKAA